MLKSLEGVRCDGRATSARHFCDVAARDEFATSLQQARDGFVTSARRICDVAATGARQIGDVAATSARRVCVVAYGMLFVSKLLNLLARALTFWRRVDSGAKFTSAGVNFLGAR